MVDAKAYIVQLNETPLIRDLQVICKPCTVKLDSTSRGMDHYHSLFELRSIKEYPLHYLARVISPFVRGQDNSGRRWDKEAALAFVDLFTLTIEDDEEALLFIRGFFPEEWDTDGLRSEPYVRRLEAANLDTYKRKRPY